MKKEPHDISLKALKKWKELGPFDMTKVIVNENLEIVTKPNYTPYCNYYGQVNDRGKWSGVGRECVHN